MANGITSLAKFVAGSAMGAALGATIGMLMAPRSGEQMQADTHAYMQNIKSEGERARQEAEARVAERFRQKVDDSSALTSKA